MTALSSTESTNTAPFGFREFVVMVASLMALGAIGVDAMLPALPAIGARLGVVTENERQFIIGIYLAGLGAGQLIHGPLSDRFGRRPVMIAALLAYAVANVVATLSGSFELLLAARLFGGIAVAATRVVTVAIVRDCYSGRPMARVMSLVVIVFMIVPVLAPTFGQFVLFFGSWRLIFGVIGVLTAIVLIWFILRMPETLAGERVPFSVGRLIQGYRMTLTDRWSLGYTLAATALQGALFGYITSVQQIVTTVFHAGEHLNLVFAGTAGMMAVANLLNSRVVMRLGSRFLSHSALVAMIAISLINVAILSFGTENLILFVVLQALTMGCFSLASANFGAMAMQDMGAIAGTASSIQGFINVTCGALIGTLIGQSFAGTTLPLHLGFLCCGLVSLGIVTIAERGRLFRPH
ncbi:MAG: major facilitator transporter [Sphingomonas bacterium]|uniref:multidrug effflux MFS transporter n=1 Tax=Sphingomonas bacterium TaxID=1895847 RepID=UPI00261FBE8F|nr:multidrug effflux MFS transporter [Sphingomonas bacterium]MDB5703137.1 major facilitator transporter [Sphingomonas bacterium]